MAELKLIRVDDITDGIYASGQELGEKLYKAIVENLKANEKMFVCFLNIEFLDTAFCRASIGELYKDFKADVIRDSVLISDLDPKRANVLSNVVKESQEIYNNKETKKGIKNTNEATKDIVETHSSNVLSVKEIARRKRIVQEGLRAKVHNWKNYVRDEDGKVVSSNYLTPHVQNVIDFMHQRAKDIDIPIKDFYTSMGHSFNGMRSVWQDGKTPLTFDHIYKACHVLGVGFEFKCHPVYDFQVNKNTLLVIRNAYPKYEFSINIDDQNDFTLNIKDELGARISQSQFVRRMVNHALTTYFEGQGMPLSIEFLNNELHHRWITRHQSIIYPYFSDDEVRDDKLIIPRKITYVSKKLTFNVEKHEAADMLDALGGTREERKRKNQALKQKQFELRNQEREYKSMKWKERQEKKQQDANKTQANGEDTN